MALTQRIKTYMNAKNYLNIWKNITEKQQLILLLLN